MKPACPHWPAKSASRFIRARLVPCLILGSVLVLPGTPLRAAPTSADELAGTGTVPVGKAPGGATAVTPAGATPQLPTAGGSDQARTMELLLQLQDKPNAFAKDQAGAASGASLRRALTATAAGDAAAENTTDVLGSMKKSMLGDGSPHSEARPETSGPTPGPVAAGDGATSSRAAAPTSEPRRSLLHNPVVRYIRENRGLVIGVSLGLLATVWLAASFSMRRRR